MESTLHLVNFLTSPDGETTPFPTTNTWQRSRFSLYKLARDPYLEHCVLFIHFSFLTWVLWELKLPNKLSRLCSEAQTGFWQEECHQLWWSHKKSMFRHAAGSRIRMVTAIYVLVAFPTPTHCFVPWLSAAPICCTLISENPHAKETQMQHYITDVSSGGSWPITWSSKVCCTGVNLFWFLFPEKKNLKSEKNRKIWTFPIKTHMHDMYL